ncbi:MAG TPA: hypothetical protein VFS54_00195 [Solirubrobacterales bacterium]|nr:hypothetical protein [Solirubrobacterales bacterium]
MKAARNVAIIMGLALIVAFLPGGGNAAATIITALTMALMAGVTWMIYVFSRENQMTLATLTDGRRALLYGAVAMILLLFAGTDKLFSTGEGTVIWILLFAASVAAIWRVWMDANTLS